MKEVGRFQFYNNLRQHSIIKHKKKQNLNGNLNNFLCIFPLWSCGKKADKLSEFISINFISSFRGTSWLELSFTLSLNPINHSPLTPLVNSLLISHWWRTPVSGVDNTGAGAARTGRTESWTLADIVRPDPGMVSPRHRKYVLSSSVLVISKLKWQCQCPARPFQNLS